MPQVRLAAYSLEKAMYDLGQELNQRPAGGKLFIQGMVQC
jgi:predicted trehalose synthase